MWICIAFYICLEGVFGGDADVMKSDSVMEGDSVTLNTDLTEIQRNDQILWMFGPHDIRISEVYKLTPSVYNSNERFRDRLQMDSQTGSLTIRNITTEHTGLYKVQIFSTRKASHKRFHITVYARLPVPVISSNSSTCSSPASPYCSLQCSVVNVSHVSLSWHKGNSLLSNISVSDLSISLSLPLEVEYQDTNTYSCMINNPISLHTTHLDISQLCYMCEDSVQCCGSTEAVIRLIISAVVGMATVAAVVYDITS